MRAMKQNRTYISITKCGDIFAKKLERLTDVNHSLIRAASNTLGAAHEIVSYFWWMLVFLSRCFPLIYLSRSAGES